MISLLLSLEGRKYQGRGQSLSALCLYPRKYVCLSGLSVYLSLGLCMRDRDNTLVNSTCRCRGRSARRTLHPLRQRMILGYVLQPKHSCHFLIPLLELLGFKLTNSDGGSQRQNSRYVSPSSSNCFGRVGKTRLFLAKL